MKELYKESELKATVADGLWIDELNNDASIASM
jgi:hypothetical protein